MGLDCVGVLLAVANSLGVAGVDFPGYGVEPDGRLEEKLEASLERVYPEDRGGCLHCHMPGDVLCFQIRKLPQHVAIRTEYGIIHALADSKWVQETSYDNAWRKRLISVWQWGEVDDVDLLPPAKPQVHTPRLQEKGCCNG